MSEEKYVKCACPACGCLIQKRDEYCSQWCEEAGETEIECKCGHQDCTRSELIGSTAFDEVLSKSLTLACIGIPLLIFCFA